MGRSGCASWVVCALVAAFLTGCLEPQLTKCDDGRLCPHGTLCYPGGCAAPAQLAACKGLEEGGSCTLPDDSTGECHAGLCLKVGCGNALVEAGEACDDGNTLGGDGCSARCDSDETCGNAFLDTAKSEGCDCGSADFTGTRPPGCNGKPNSDDPDTVCTSNCTIRGCGDGAIGGLEDCDGTALGGKTCTDVGYYGGTLACKDSCKFEVAACSGRCGDGTRNGTPTELCDGSDLGGSDCQTFGYYNAVGLSCNALCGLDTTACTGYCGDNQFQSANEVCDSKETEAQLNARGLDCTDFGFYAPGGLACGSNCQIDTSSCSGGYCGDGLREAGEDCDGVDLAGETCIDFGYYQAAALACRPNCTFDTGACSMRCGDGVVNGPEDCDGSVAAGTDCTDFGYYSPGTVGCRSTCSFDLTGCATAGRCGDSIKNGGEQCDGSVGAMTCVDLGFYNPAGLSCTAACSFDVSGCTGVCGDGVRNGGEQCDGSDLGGSSCQALGYYNSAGLACGPDCRYDESSCSGFCGDGIVNGAEDCDGRPPASTCLDLGYDGGRPSCSHFCTPDVKNCDRFGWWTVPPPAAGLVMTAVAGTGPSNVWVLANSYLYHYDGASWTKSPATPRAAQIDIWIAAANDVWVAGYNGGVSRFNGTSWVDNSPPGTPTYNALWGSSANDVFVVGTGGSGGLVAHYTGTWTSVTVGSNILSDVWGTGPSNAFAVGWNGAAYHWNGSTWVAMTTGTTSSLNAVWGTGPSDVWAVGDNGVIVHYDGNVGNTWTTVTSGTTSRLAGIWGASASHVFVVGANAFLHYDGATWQRIQSRVSSATSVWGSSGDDVWAVGGAIAAHFSGHAMRTLVTNTSADLFGVWSAAKNDAFFVGASGTFIRYDGAVGAAMSVSPSTGAALRAVWGTSSSNVFAVGSGGLIERWTGGPSWSSVTSSTTGELRGIWGPNASNAFAVATNGDIVKWNGSSWTSSRQGSVSGSTYFEGVWGTSATNVFAVTTGARAQQYNGSSWTAVGPTLFAHAIAGSGTKLAFAGTARYDGTSWFNSVGAPSSTDCCGANGLWAQTPKNIFSAGASGEIYHFDGLGWVPMRSGTGADLNAVSGSGTAVHFVGAGGVALELDNYCGTSERRCSNQWDDDCDGLLNCEDSDCATDPFCVAGGACGGWTAVTCGATVNASNSAGTALIDTYGCAGTQAELGAEVVYRLVAPATQSVTVSVSKNAFLDLAVLPAGAGGSCDPNACLGGSSNAVSNGTDQVTFNATSGSAYYIVIDGRTLQDTAPFTLQVSCN